MTETVPKTQGPFTVGNLRAPPFVTFTNVTAEGVQELEYVITNEATCKYFLANHTTVQLFAAIRETGSVAAGLARSGIPRQHGEALLKRLIEAGLLVSTGATNSKQDIKAAPLESKLISMRWDLFDASRVTQAFGWLGRVLFSPLGYIGWVASLVAMIFALASNSEKVGLGLRQLLDASWYQFALFGLFYVLLKVIHEMGHALAYRTMCLREGLDPGPIRMGISIFAFTPFPFTDVTGAWRLRSVHRRIMIGAGGIYFETWAIAAFTLLWSQIQSGLLQTTILQVVVVAGLFALLFNLNPAIKLDGYYMLTDYLRRPNLAGRASIAARGTFAKMFGVETSSIVWADLGYWLLSYGYRWTIFGGIFWLVYQFDPRLGPAVGAVVFMTLLGRPFYNSAKFVLKSGAKPLRSILACTVLAGLVVLCFVPLPDRILLPGQMRHYETSFLEPPEGGTLRLSQTGEPVLVNPVLDHQIEDLELRQAMLENLKRAGATTGAAIAQLTSELESFERSKSEMLARRETLSKTIDNMHVWTPMDVDAFEGSWVSPSANLTLGAISTPIPARLRLRLDQALLERGISLNRGVSLTVRPVHDPSCSFAAQLDPQMQDPIAIDGVFLLDARPVSETDPCARGIRHGGAVIARLETRYRSVIERIRLGGSRLLQNRLPVDLN